MKIIEKILRCWENVLIKFNVWFINTDFVLNVERGSTLYQRCQRQRITTTHCNHYWSRSILQFIVHCDGWMTVMLLIKCDTLFLILRSTPASTNKTIESSAFNLIPNVIAVSPSCDNMTLTKIDSKQMKKNEFKFFRFIKTHIVLEIQISSSRNQQGNFRALIPLGQSHQKCQPRLIKTSWFNRKKRWRRWSTKLPHLVCLNYPQCSRRNSCHRDERWT